METCTHCQMMPAGKYCLSHTCIDCGAYSTDVENHHCS